ncbi:MAG: indolepyruvate oxidoreductase subunit beta [Clostridia bacterium]|nr:indolepyruvate oxidoreductase subunit beta [Clostridia bacterium]
MKTTNIMIVGVGGQGTLLASKVLGQLFLNEQYDVKVSEVHGMSQRGGSVVTYVRFGETCHSPVICEGEADFILSFEKLEAARYIRCLSPSGIVLTNDQEIAPMPVITGAAEYPHEILQDLSALGARVVSLDALALARQAGSVKAVNIVLLGKLSTFFTFSEEAWLAALEAVIPKKLFEMNRTAFLLGRSA